MFDEVGLSCPHCEEYIILQSKAGNCTLKLYNLDNLPLSILADLQEDKLYCYKCNKRFWLHVQLIKSVTPITMNPKIGESEDD